MNTFDKVAESNRIEGIRRPPTEAEIQEHERFVRVDLMTITELERFVKVYQPNAVLRDKRGLDVYVGNHHPPPGGIEIPHMLNELLDEANADKISPWKAHITYETIHPFTDGNGRSGRALWYWMMAGHLGSNLGFLHYFYYETLRNSHA